MEELRKLRTYVEETMYVEQTMKESHMRLIRLTKEAFQLHDAIQDGGGDSDMLSVPRSSSPERIQHLQQQYDDTLEMMNQELSIMAFDPNPSWNNCYCPFEEVWNRLRPEMKSERAIIIAILFWFLTKRHLNHDYHFVESWLIEEAPMSIRHDPCIILFRLCMMKRSKYRECSTIDEQIPDFLNLPVEIWSYVAIVRVAVRRFPDVVLNHNLVPDCFFKDKDVFLAFVEGCPPYQDNSFHETPLSRISIEMSRFSIEIRSNLELMIKLVKKFPRCFEHVHESLKDNHDIILAASSKSLAVLKTCHPNLQQQLFSNKPFVLKLLAVLPKYLVHDRDLLNLLLPEQHQGLSTVEDFDIILAASASSESLAVLKACHPSIQQQLFSNKPFVLKLLAVLPEYLMHDRDFLYLLLLEQLRDLSTVEDFDIILAACIKSRAAVLEACHPSLQQQLFSNKPFVLKFIASRLYNFSFGFEKFYKSILPEHLQCDPDILDLLLPMAGEFKVEDFTTTIPTDRQFWLRACRHRSVDCSLWQQLPDEFKDDPEFLAALHFKCKEMALFAIQGFPELANSRQFWLSACANVLSSSLWQQIPDEFKSNPEFLECLRFGPDSEVVEFAFHDMPQLAASREFWKAVIKSEGYSDIPVDLIRDHATVEIRQDRDLMLLACSMDYEVYTLIDEHLQENEEFLTLLLELNDDAFRNIPLHIQSMHPGLTAKALVSLEDCDWVYLNQIDERLWNNQEVMKAYVHYNNKGDDWNPELPEALKSIEAFGLFAAKDVECISDPSDFTKYTSSSLRSNKAFMMKAVAHKPFYFFARDGGLSTDFFDLAIMAFSPKIDCCDMLFGDRWDDQPAMLITALRKTQADYDYKSELDVLHSVATKAREMVRLFEWHHDAFVPVFENPDSTPNPDHTLLPVMFKHDVTARALKKKILIFLGSDPVKGLPDEEQVRHLRATSLHLLFPANSWAATNGLMPKSERFFHCD